MDGDTPATSAPAARVLIVEDVRVVAMVVAAALKANGYEVVGQAQRGSQATEMAAALHPDLILMDVNLDGDMDGIEAAKAIRTGIGTPVVFLTSQTDEETLHRARSADPHGYLVKPLEPRMLRPTLELALHRHALEVERAQLTKRLQETLHEVTQLRGLLPACAWCRRIRDDEGYWHTLEAYLSKYLNTQYTHGICDRCADKMAQELEQREKSKQPGPNAAP